MDATIKATFWTDPKIEAQPYEIKFACLWLITNPARDLCGFTTVSNRRFTFETGLTPDFLDALSIPLRSSFAKVDEHTFFAVNFLRHQFGKGGRLNVKNKVLVAAGRLADKLPERQRAAFFEAYPELLVIIESAPSNPNKTEGGSIPHPENRDGVRVRVREGERVGEDIEVVDVPSIVALYPRRQNLHAACEAVGDWLKKGVDPEAIRTGTRAHAEVIAKLPGGALNKYVEGAATFFRERKWEDDPQTRLRSSGNQLNGAPAGTLDLGGRANSGTTIKIPKILNPTHA